MKPYFKTGQIKEVKLSMEAFAALKQSAFHCNFLILSLWRLFVNIETIAWGIHKLHTALKKKSWFFHSLYNLISIRFGEWMHQLFVIIIIIVHYYNEVLRKKLNKWFNIIQHPWNDNKTQYRIGKFRKNEIILKTIYHTVSSKNYRGYLLHILHESIFYFVNYRLKRPKTG